MANGLDLKLIVKHLVNGTFERNLCRICLMPLPELSENIFTKICKQDKEFCIADVLKELCDIQFSDTDDYNVCIDCFTAASNAYKFYLNTLHHNEILNAYTDQLSSNIACIDMLDDENDESICISLPVVTPDIPVHDFNIEGVITEKRKMGDDLITDFVKSKPFFNDRKLTKRELKHQRKMQTKIKTEPTKDIEDDEEAVFIIDNENDEPTFYKFTPNGVLYKIEYNSTPAVPKRKMKKRERMTSKKCSRCPVKYHFVAKLREHMWLEHQVQLFHCKICHQLLEDVKEYNFHMNLHTNIYQCAFCSIVFKKREIIVAHLKLHEELKSAGVDNIHNVCKTCGIIMNDEDSLRAHRDVHELKGFTCYYCGRMYKQESGFNNHIRKHELYMKLKQNKKQSSKRESNLESQKHKNVEAQQEDRNYTCELCGRSFLSQRGLLWHSRLHTNERPFTCDVCGRSFVSLNRRNQHRLCAHTAPTRRCPLCPALFHMKSMVNTHIKKVHLKSHKRRSRTVRRGSVSWHTEPVPIQELSIAIQNDILELQAKNNQASANHVYSDGANED